MKPVMFGIVAMSALTLAAPSIGAAQVRPAAGAVVSSDKPADKQIEKAIKEDPSLKHAKIHVSVDEGVVTLTGTVPTEAEKARAARIAHVSGITRVDNQLVVDPSMHTKGTSGTIASTGKKGAEKTKEGAEYVGEKTKEGAEKTWDKTKEGAGKVADESSDAYILTRVKSRFVGVDVLKGSDINVDVDNKVVTLKGTVASEAARERAIDIAKHTEGVHDVVDRLTIGSKR